MAISTPSSSSQLDIDGSWHASGNEVEARPSERAAIAQKKSYVQAYYPYTVYFAFAVPPFRLDLFVTRILALGQSNTLDLGFFEVRIKANKSSGMKREKQMWLYLQPYHEAPDPLA